jgi:hypothetical protein
MTINPTYLAQRTRSCTFLSDPPISLPSDSRTLEGGADLPVCVSQLSIGQMQRPEYASLTENGSERLVQASIGIPQLSPPFVKSRGRPEHTHPGGARMDEFNL